MREIKFRGIGVNTKEWVYGYLVIEPNGRVWIGESVRTISQVTPETIGQFTGLKDKDGKGIYEGDVVKTDYYSGTPGDFKRLIGIVKYYRCSFMVDGIRKYEGLIKELHGNTEIIRNIHENPELL